MSVSLVAAKEHLTLVLSLVADVEDFTYRSSCCRYRASYMSAPLDGDVEDLT